MNAILVVLLTFAAVIIYLVGFLMGLICSRFSDEEKEGMDERRKDDFIQ